MLDVSIFIVQICIFALIVKFSLKFRYFILSISIWLDRLSNLIFLLITSTFSFSSSTGLAPLLINIWLLPLLAIKDIKQEYNTWNKVGVVNCLSNPEVKLYLHLILWDNVLLSFLNCWINYQAKILWIKGISWFYIKSANVHKFHSYCLFIFVYS